ncbi:threonine synthase [Thermophagus xiamenensis]|uniref:Threonine synthase n=1 Tax=Thermophagus xiamenensis TaxID=385682 RepID=A0A1I1WNB3_9BACT|nr:threonine synthase [Thermophagus xiamenensis]SFD94590.1 L-threonine synthase [Thermophagus xiamenensis]
MKYISLGKDKQIVTLSEGIFKGLADDGSLFMPEEIPILDPSFYNRFTDLSLQEIAYNVLLPYVEDELNGDALKKIVQETFSFPIPLENICGPIYSLELFHGPTQAFKDVGARFLSRLMSHLHPVKKRKMVVLTATSGDTGGAVAHGFYKVPGIEVVILYPKGKISPYQENQMTSLGHNIHAIAVEGVFDDCQNLVKRAFNDGELRKEVMITSANSINLGRLLPQMVYYFWGVAALRKKMPGINPVICVPSGNFGNITAAVMAFRMGLPVKRFVAATNVNDVVPRYLNDGIYDPRQTIETYANAMDVGNPNNFPRLFHLFNKDLDKLRQIFSAISITDKQILETIQSVKQQYDYLLDPHSSTGFLCLNQSLHDDEKGFFISTAHPVKFVEIIEKVLPQESERLIKEFGADKVPNNILKSMPVSYNVLKEKLLEV